MRRFGITLFIALAVASLAVAPAIADEYQAPVKEGVEPLDSPAAEAASGNAEAQIPAVEPVAPAAEPPAAENPPAVEQPPLEP